RPYKGLPDLGYPFHDRTLTVTRCGRVCLHAADPFAAKLSPMSPVRTVTDVIGMDKLADPGPAWIRTKDQGIMSRETAHLSTFTRILFHLRINTFGTC